MTTTESTFDASSEATSRDSGCESRLDAVFDALASPACRVVLARLATADDALGAADLAQELDDLGERPDDFAEWSGEESDSASDSAGDSLTGPTGATLARLHHTYLPKLDDVGLVTYDADRELVESTPTAESGALRTAVEDVAAADLPVELDALFGLLSNARRRQAFRTLLAHEEASLADLADDVAVAERDWRLSRIDPDDVLEVYLSLYHTHVPKLTATDVARYDQELDLVALTDAGRRLESAVEALCEAVEA